MGRHAEPSTFDATVNDYVIGRAKELVRQFDMPWELADPYDRAAWMGVAAEILRELTRDA